MIKLVLAYTRYALTARTSVAFMDGDRN